MRGTCCVICVYIDIEIIIECGQRRFTTNSPLVYNVETYQQKDTNKAFFIEALNNTELALCKYLANLINIV